MPFDNIITRVVNDAITLLCFHIKYNNHIFIGKSITELTQSTKGQKLISDRFLINSQQHVTDYIHIMWCRKTLDFCCEIKTNVKATSSCTMHHLKCLIMYHITGSASPCVNFSVELDWTVTFTIAKGFVIHQQICSNNNCY